MPDLLAAWLLTYLVHSTLLLGGAWLLTRLWRRIPVAWGEALWRAAVLGGLITASLQLALDVEPAGGRMAMPTTPPPVVADTAPALELPAPLPLPPAHGEPLPAIGPQPEPIVTADAAAPVPATPARASLPALAWIALVWAAGCALGLVRHGRARGRLRARLATRVPLTEGPLHARLAQLVRTAGLRRMPRLSEASGLGSPLAVGVLRPEIVVPARAERELTVAQQDAMLAHELAHHIRRDALWQSALRLLTTLFFFQPLHAVARRRLHESAELLSDAWAVEHTGCSRSLAECLTVVAGWMVGGPRAQPAPAMAARGSMLVRRVERLVDHDLPSAAPRARVGASLLAVLPLIAVVLAAPSVATGTADGPSPVERSEDVFAIETTVDPIHVPVVPIVDGPSASQVDADIARLEEELATLLALVKRVDDPPPALRAGVARLESRLQSLKTRRAALLVVAPAKEMAR